MTEIRSLFLCLWLLAAVDSFEVIEPSEPINVRDDEALELTCTGSNPWLYCKWSFYEKDCARSESGKHFLNNIMDAIKVKMFPLTVNIQLISLAVCVR